MIIIIKTMSFIKECSHQDLPNTCKNFYILGKCQISKTYFIQECFLLQMLKLDSMDLNLDSILH